LVDRVAGEFLVIIGHEPHLPEDVFGHRHDERPIAFGARGAAPSGVVWAVNKRPSLVRTLLLCAPPSRASGKRGTTSFDVSLPPFLLDESKLDDTDG